MPVSLTFPLAALAIVVAVSSCALPVAQTGAAAPVLPNQVRSLTAVQREGYATLKWAPVPGATDYQIERTLVDATGSPAGDSVISGIWRPNRQVRQESPSFADAGFVPGGRFRWRVRARIADSTQPFSSSVVAATLPPSGPAEFLTEFEMNNGTQYTSHESEMEWTRRLAAASQRVRVVAIGKTALGRDINLFIFGLPAPRASAAEISAAPGAGANCNVHGNEPSGREGCFIMIRNLAFSNDPWVIDILSNATILIVPSFNGDGRAANTRGNSTGQDLNRDHAAITQPESQAFAAFLRDYTPEVMVDGHEYGSGGTCDLPLLWPRHSNTSPPVHNEAKVGLVEGWMYNSGADDGWWPCPYPPAGIEGARTFTRVTGLKNMITTLVEARSGGGPTRPAEGSTGANRLRKAYSQLWAARTALDYHRHNVAAVRKAIADGIAFQRSNTGRIVLHGDWDLAAFPAPHPGDRPPPGGAPGPSQIVDPPPCGYFVTEEQYSTKLSDSGRLADSLRTSLAQRLEAHGIAVERTAGGYLVRMAQPLRGLINILLDPEQPPAPIVAGERRYQC
jgi:hypothetical protein